MKKRKKVSRNRRNISESKRIRRTNKLFATFPFVLLLLLLIALLLIYKPILTGLVTSEKEISFDETLNATIPLNDTIANGTIANETLILPINKSIIINLKYKNGTSYDAGNDGI